MSKISGQPWIYRACLKEIEIKKQTKPRVMSAHLFNASLGAKRYIYIRERTSRASLVHACNPSYPGSYPRSSLFEASLGK
jgi:hypothetical protein